MEAVSFSAEGEARGLPPEVFTGWGRTAPSRSQVVRPGAGDDVGSVFAGVGPRGVVARGLGRSYGDAAQNAGGRLAVMTAHSEFRLDPGSGTVTAGGGASIDSLLRSLVPRGFFVPVTPGTRQVTVGGAIAADIHGKNHHVSGSFSAHVEELTLLTPDGGLRVVGPDRDPQLFWATVGGMGLTGVVVEATFRCPPIASGRVLVDTDRTDDLDGAFALLADDQAQYSVAWLDGLARGGSLGRSVVTRGRFALPEELPSALRSRPFAFAPRHLVAAPPGIPSGLLRPVTIAAFNEVWYRKAPRRRQGELQSISTFFHPLDGVIGWNRLYGPRGFLQWQCVVPLEATDVIRSAVERLSAARMGSFLGVLKRMGPRNEGHLSFPDAGWTLALDLPCGDVRLPGLLDELDLDVVGSGGRLYLAKDSRCRPELIGAMYPRLDEWREVQSRVDPSGLLRSDLSRRLRLLD